MSTTKKKLHADVTIIGSGIAGGILAAILARNGLDVILIDKLKHPKFAIGESTIPETALLFQFLASRFNVPELAEISTFQKGRTNLPLSGIKRNFGFMYHSDSQFSHAFSHQLGAANDEHAINHFFRQEVDHFVAKTAVLYGCHLYEGVGITDVSIDNDGATLSIDDGNSIHCDYVVDAGGEIAIVHQVSTP